MHPLPLRKPLARILGSLFLGLGTHASAAVLDAPEVEVVGTTPLPGIGLARRQVPANVQVLGREAISDAGSLNLPDALNRKLGSVTINEVQGNPYQPDISYRGFTASPLLGTPQGLSVYMDGVRLNQPFGDVVSWDLIPRSAIGSLNLMPGSNPLFGLNTLGGAISIETKDGLSNPGSAVQLIVGSNKRQALEFEHGGHNDKGLNWFLTGNVFKEDGWRDSSPSDLGQLFGKLGWTDAKTDLSLTLAMANTRLTGNGMQEQRLLEENYASVYSKPDETNNRSLFLNLSGKHSLNEQVMLSGNAYYRKIRTSTLNGDVNDNSLNQDAYLTGTGTGTADRAWLDANGYAGLFPLYAESRSNTAFPFWACIAQAGQGDEPGEKCNGLINRSESTQDNYGLSGQFTVLGTLAGHKNQFTGGAGYDASRSHFRQSTQLGYLNADRSITGINAYADGVTGGDVDGAPFDNRVDLTGRTRTWSVYATDTLSIGDLWHLTVSGRYNQTRVENRDQINPGGGSGSLDGDHRFSRFNPAIGLAVTPSKELSLYGGYNEGSRTPTAIELGCADPANPCKLPNAMAGDPPLRQVVTKTWEAGVRGTLGGKTRWNAGVFRAVNNDDIQFVATTSGGSGYFKNFGQTRRQGLELRIDTQLEPFTFSLNYTWLDATFQSHEILNGNANSSNDAGAGLEGNITIKPGDRMPLMPRHVLKAHVDWQINGAWSAGLGMQAVSGSLARGNENGQHQPDGTYYLGEGRSPGYAIFDLSGKYQASRQLSFFGQINNLFDRRYSTAAQLGATAFNASGAFVARPFGPADNDAAVSSTFFAPGAPRTAWVGVRYEFSK